jgi:hypothetical protein
VDGTAPDYPSSAVTLPIMEHDQTRTRTTETGNRHAGHNEPVINPLASEHLGVLPVDTTKKVRMKGGKKGKQKASGQRRPEFAPPRSGQGEGHQHQLSQLSHPANNDTKTAFNTAMLAENQQALHVASGPKNSGYHTQNEESESSLPHPNKGQFGWGQQNSPVTSQEVEATVEMEEPERQVLCLSEDPHPVPNALTSPNQTPIDDPADSSRNAEVEMMPQISSGLLSLSMKEDPRGSAGSVDPSQGPRGTHPRSQQYVETAPTAEDMVKVDHEPADVDSRDLFRLSHAAVSNNVLDPALDQVLDRGRPHRVAKPRKKSRVAQNSQTRTPAVNSYAPASRSALNVNRAMESLRVALLTDQLRTEYDHDLDVERWKGANSALKNKIGAHEVTIENLRSQQQEWMSNAGRFTERAIINQKFAKGIQADYEKLRKEAAAFHLQSEQILQKEIAEMEKERTDLRREFEKTTTSMERSQRGMLSAMKEMHERLSSTEGQRKLLVQQILEKEKRCTELKTQILVSEQKARSQPDPVVERLDRIYSQHDQANTQRTQELLKVNQSLTEMRETLLTPATAEDLGRVNSGLNQLAER